MWYLKSDLDPRVIYIVSAGRGITIGRSTDTQSCSFPVLDDSSISRKHAILSITDNCLYVQDLSSRYGTSINDYYSQIEAEKKIKLIDGDSVKFGKLNSIWKVQQLNLVTCTSTVKGENLENLKITLSKLGAMLKNEWNDSCSYLTMPAITLTIKVVLALVQGAHIVTLDYWNKCLQAVENNTALPEPKQFIPQVIESTLNKENVSFIPDEKRKHIFKNKQFVFFSKKQLDMYRMVLVKSSADSLLLSESKLTKSMLCSDNVIVVQYNISHVSHETQAQKTQMDDIVNFLKCKGKRVIPDAEIGLAILFGSTTKYCNPNFNFSSEVMKQVPEMSSASRNILAQESQETINRFKKENVVIDESLVSSHDRSAKRKPDDDIKTNASKKMATTKNIFGMGSDGSKRKLSDDENSSNSNKKMAFDNDSDDFFNFMNPVTVNNERETEKTLNFSKPLKRKADVMDEDDNLFNFIQDKSKTSENDQYKRRLLETSNETNQNSGTANKEDELDMPAIRGSKLGELMKNHKTINYKNIKKENADELESKMNNLELGTTIVTIKDDLIVKKEPLQIEETSSQVKNFKKFKKVWPVKMQVLVVPKAVSLSNFESSNSIAC